MISIGQVTCTLHIAICTHVINIHMKTSMLVFIYAYPIGCTVIFIDINA